MSRESTDSKAEKLHSDCTNRINDMLIEFQDESRSMQAKDAFWYAFEYARSRYDEANIQAAWENYKNDRNNIKG